MTSIFLDILLSTGMRFHDRHHFTKTCDVRAHSTSLTLPLSFYLIEVPVAKPGKWAIIHLCVRNFLFDFLIQYCIFCFSFFVFQYKNNNDNEKNWVLCIKQLYKRIKTNCLNYVAWECLLLLLFFFNLLISFS